MTLGDVPPGLYRLYAAGPAGEGDSLAALVAVNGDARESDLTAVPLAEATARLRTATGLNVDAAPALRPADVQGKRTAAAEGRELWPLLLALAFALLLVETVLSRRLRPATA